ncbi:MAG: hypothetical protein A4E64_01675 [Syntrophorhabdus sp. PtaU1.Bin058]|nr:MAG: hypothetical protein A4E64_01675 [Syntrophorhabdus sp. PtaU1.Bin058]
MASIDSLRYFPVVKIVPTSMFGEDETMSGVGEIALGKMAAQALETLRVIINELSSSETAGSSFPFKAKLHELYGQLDRINKYLESGE